MIDYYAIQESINNIISGGTYTDTVKEFFIEGMERDQLLGNCPFINNRLVEARIEQRSLPNGYYAYVLFKIDIVAFNFTEFKKAVIVRDRLLKEVQLRLQSNRNIGGAAETSSIGPQVTFAAGMADNDDEQTGHVASATFDLVVEVFIEPA